jgi:hypothetical protein
MAEYISWIATGATIAAACMTASNLGARITGYGFGVFTIGSLSWLATGMMTGQPALVWTNVVLTVLNIFGVWRWLGRQARVEEGGRSAAEASESIAGEPLFPVSLLARAPVTIAGAQAGSCLDAMAGCHSGRLAYLAVSEGGVGGVGEVFRKLPWRDAHVDAEQVVARIAGGDLSSLEELPKDQWPGR